MKIKNKEYKFKITLRAMMIFEQITGKPFNINGVLDEYIYFYSLLMANNNDFNYTFEEFIDILDESPNLIKDYKEALEDYGKKMNVFNKEESEDVDSKKKL